MLKKGKEQKSLNEMDHVERVSSLPFGVSLHNAKAQASVLTVLCSVSSVNFPELLFSVRKQIQFPSS